MKFRSHLFVFIACTLLLPLKVIAGACDAHFTFDGNLNDSSGNAYNGQMIGAKGVVASPQFVDGKYGQALQFDGTSAMRSFVDLHFDTCPEVTVTAWIQVTDGERKGTQELVSTGSGSGPGIRLLGANLILKGSANGIMRRNVVRPNAGWMFVAGVYDYTNGTYTLYSRNRGMDKQMGKSRKPPEEAIWVGAFNDDLANAATNIVIDDVRIYGRLFNKDEIQAVRTGAGITGRDGGTLNALAPTNLPGAAPTQIPGDQFDPATPTQIPGDQFDPATPTLIPGDQFDPATPTLIPGDQFDPETPTLIPGDQFDPAMPTQIPGDQFDPATPTLIPGDQFDPTVPVQLPDSGGAAELSVEPEDGTATQGAMPKLFGDP